ncbi:MAG: AbgT family transporter [Bacilli bacterium]
MKEHKKLKLKKFHLHPITSIILATLFVIMLSGILSAFEMQATYSKVNAATNQLESVLVTVESLCNYNGLKYIISNAARNFISFTPLSTLLIALLGVCVASATGLLDTFFKRYMIKLDKKQVTFLLIFLATISSIINDVGYAILIPLGAMLFAANGRNPFAGIIAAFSGVAFGYGATIFVGSMEVNLIPATTAAAALIDKTSHISLTSNLFIIIVTSLILSFVGTIIMEKIVIPKLGRYKEKEGIESTDEIEIIDVEKEEQSKLEIDSKEKKGLKGALIAGIIILFIFIYSLIPGLPFSGLLLDMTETTYLNQLFGINSYFQDGFTYMVAIFLIITGIAYGIGSKTIKSDRDLFEKTSIEMKSVGSLVILIFFAAQFIAVFKKTNIGTVITSWGANIIGSLEFTGIPLILLIIAVIAVANLFVTTPVLKWSILSSTVVPSLMQSNITPAFAQFILRASDSMTKGITPLLAYFVIYIGYLNIYNRKKDKPITISQSISWLLPYCLIISLTWILIILGWYLIGLPLGPSVFPTA